MLDYRLGDIRATVALLSQDHSLFTLSVAENIALGRPQLSRSTCVIEEAARKSGAHKIVSKFDLGYDTVLGSTQTKETIGLSSNHPLRKMHDKLEKGTQVSGEL
jgi:ABC-type multidrug transport system fused ATPase/permease subunit